jgi:hypothetical protein
MLHTTYLDASHHISRSQNAWYHHLHAQKTTRWYPIRCRTVLTVIVVAGTRTVTFHCRLITPLLADRLCCRGEIARRWVWLYLALLQDAADHQVTECSLEAPLSLVLMTALA